jgi:hypothetical protein
MGHITQIWANGAGEFPRQEKFIVISPPGWCFFRLAFVFLTGSNNYLQVIRTVLSRVFAAFRCFGWVIAAPRSMITTELFATLKPILILMGENRCRQTLSLKNTRGEGIHEPWSDLGRHWNGTDQ